MKCKYLCKLLCLICFFSVSTFVQTHAQKVLSTQYLDSLFSPVKKIKKAFYVSKIIQKDAVYEEQIYWVRSNKMKQHAAFADITLQKPRDYKVVYYETGQVEDSALYNTSGIIVDQYNYYSSGRLWAYETFDPATNTRTTDGYEENGGMIPGFVLEREASFPGGNAAWVDFLSSNINLNIPIQNKAPAGTYQIFVKFVVGTDGSVGKIEPESDPGYGMEAEAMRVIARSPKWEPAIYRNEVRKAYRRQPLTFELN